MNCKPPCLAIVKRGLLGLRHAGKVVEVLAEPWPCTGNGPEWSVVFRESIERIDGTTGRRCSCPDAWLMPIDNPGDDAVDESLAYLPPVPTQTKETV